VYNSNQKYNQEIEFLDRDTFKKIGRVQLDSSLILDTSCKPIFNDKDRICFLDQSAVSVLLLSVLNLIPIILLFLFIEQLCDKEH